MAGERRWEVFLAYASPDRERARVLYQGLVAAGVSVCWDQAVLRAGDNWYRLLPAHLRASEMVVVLVSAHTDDAHFEESEVILGLEQVRREGGRLVPILLHPGAVVPYGTEALQSLDFFEDGAVEGVVRALVDVVPRPIVGALPGTQVWCSRIPAVPLVFAGREELLARLAASTKGGGGAVLTQTIQGMGGVGKTTVAAALADAQRHQLDVVWWARSEQPSGVGWRPG